MVKIVGFGVSKEADYLNDFELEVWPGNWEVPIERHPHRRWRSLEESFCVLGYKWSRTPLPSNPAATFTL